MDDAHILPKLLLSSQTADTSGRMFGVVDDVAGNFAEEFANAKASRSTDNRHQAKAADKQPPEETAETNPSDDKSVETEPAPKESDDAAATNQESTADQPINVSTNEEPEAPLLKINYPQDKDQSTESTEEEQLELPNPERTKESSTPTDNLEPLPGSQFHTSKIVKEPPVVIDEAPKLATKEPDADSLIHIDDLEPVQVDSLEPLPESQISTSGIVKEEPVVIGEAPKITTELVAETQAHQTPISPISTNPQPATEQKVKENSNIEVATELEIETSTIDSSKKIQKWPDAKIDQQTNNSAVETGEKLGSQAAQDVRTLEAELSQEPVPETRDGFHDIVPDKEKKTLTSLEPELKARIVESLQKVAAATNVQTPVAEKVTPAMLDGLRELNADLARQVEDTQRTRRTIQSQPQAGVVPNRHHLRPSDTRKTELGTVRYGERFEELKEKVVEQVRVQVKAVAGGKKQTATIRLHPRFLGQIDVKLTVEEGSAKAQFLVENQSVRELLHRSSSDLQRALEEHGIDADQVEIDVADRDDGADHENRAFSTAEEQEAAREWLATFQPIAAAENSEEESGNKNNVQADEDNEQVLNILA